MNLAELDLFLGVVVAGGAEHDEERVAVILELGALVGVHRVLERQFMEAECLADRFELVGARLFEPDPRKAPSTVAAALGRVVDLDRPVVLALPTGVVGAVDDHAVDWRSALKAAI